MTDVEFATVIRTIEGYYPGRTWNTDTTLDVWWSQMQHWDFDCVMLAMPTLARRSPFLPSFSEVAEGYRIEKLKQAPPPELARPRHLSAIADPEHVGRWTRVIMAQLRNVGTGDPGPVNHAVRRHYRIDAATGLIVMDGKKMLADAEAALAESAFSEEA